MTSILALGTISLAVAALVAWRARGQPPAGAPRPPQVFQPAADAVPRVAADSLRAWLAAHPGAVLVDVRTPDEFAGGHVRGARNLDVQASDFAERAATLERGKPYVLYCRSGARSERAGRMLRQLGIVDLVNAGGFDALARAGFPVERSP